MCGCRPTPPPGKPRRAFQPAVPPSGMMHPMVPQAAPAAPPPQPYNAPHTAPATWRDMVAAHRTSTRNALEQSGLTHQALLAAAHMRAACALTSALQALPPVMQGASVMLLSKACIACMLARSLPDDAWASEASAAPANAARGDAADADARGARSAVTSAARWAVVPGTAVDVLLAMSDLHFAMTLRLELARMRCAHPLNPVITSAESHAMCALRRCSTEPTAWNAAAKGPKQR